MKTREEIEELKRQWLYDPCWDIEDTEGFEDHREELEQYHAEQRAIWDFEAEQRAIKRALRMGTTGNSALTETLCRIENRLESIMERLDKLESR